MTKLLRKYFILFVTLAPIVGHANEHPVKPAHKPPILTTTAIIEVRATAFS